MRRGVNSLATSRRSRVWSGGSDISMWASAGWSCSVLTIWPMFPDLRQSRLSRGSVKAVRHAS